MCQSSPSVVGDPNKATQLTGCLVFQALRGAQHDKFEAHILLPHVPELIAHLGFDLFLPHQQVSGKPTCALHNVIWKVVECKLGLLLGSMSQDNSLWLDLA